MHSSFAKRCAILEGLRERARIATTEFYQKPSVMPPPLAPLIIVRPIGNNTFSRINHTTGVIVAERFGHNDATSHARALEAKAAQFSIRQFGQLLRNWTLRSSGSDRLVDHKAIPVTSLKVTIKSTPYVIVDICLRILQPAELYKAQGFPADYIISHGADGKPFIKTQQVYMCGNSVSPPPMAALARANDPWRAAQQQAEAA